MNAGFYPFEEFGGRHRLPYTSSIRLGLLVRRAEVSWYLIICLRMSLRMIEGRKKSKFKATTRFQKR